MSENTFKKPQRIYWLDVARVIAIISISCNHAINRSYATYTGQLEEYLSIPFISTTFKAVIYIFSRIGVPLFLMISGALLLSKNINDGEGVKKFYKHNLLSLFITSEIWYFIVYCLKAVKLFLTGRISVKGFILGLFETMLFVNQNTMVSFWYLPMILCAYLLIPFMCILKNKITWKNIVIPMIALFYIGFVIPTGDSFFRVLGIHSIIPAENMVIVSLYFIYIIVGYWISQGNMGKVKTPIVAVSCAVSFLLTCVYQIIIYTTGIDYPIIYDNVGILLSSIFLFELFRRFSNDLIKLRRPVEYISRIAFGIYFVHIVIMTILVDYLPNVKTALPQPAYFFFLELVSVGGSIIIIAITSKIPFVKKYLYMIK